MTTQTARDAFDEWAEQVQASIKGGAFPGDRRIELLGEALSGNGGRDRQSVWIAFSAGWVSAMTVTRRFAEDEGALSSDDED